MDLSALDGFLAGLAAGPGAVPPSEWLAEVLDNQEPDYESETEKQAVLDAIFAHQEAIQAALDASPLAYAPILWQDATGTTVASDWAAGFMQAVAMRRQAWEPALADEDASALLFPIASLAEAAVPEMERGPGLTDDALVGLIGDAEQVLPVCVLGLRRFWQARAAGDGMPRH